MRIFMTIVLLGLGLCGLGVSLCGAWVTVASLADLKHSAVLLYASVPSIVGGGLIMWRARERFRELQKADLDSEHE